MLRAAAGVPLVELARGRGKLRDAWGVVEALSAHAEILRTLDGRAYRTSEALGGGLLAAPCNAEAVDGQRVALPEHGAHLDLATLLDGSGLRQAFEEPSSLEQGPPGSSPVPIRPFTGKRCDRLPASERALFARRLDRAGMLFVTGQESKEAGGLFATRKGWNADRGDWDLRLLLDRRPRNACEELVGTDVLCASMPHGSSFCEVVLPADKRMLLWATDLPSFYYACRVTPERAATNQFTQLVPLAGLDDLAAVQAYRARVRAGEVGRAERGALCLNSLAMGDLNATGFAQAGHRRLLEQVRALPPELAYYAPCPLGDVLGGVMIDDFVLAALVPLEQDATRPSAAQQHAESLFTRARAAYVTAGVPDVEKKRVVAADEATAWGCQVRGREGVAGTALAKRAALAALTGAIAESGVGCGPLLASVQGMWVDALLYRRAALSLLAAIPNFVVTYGEDARPRTLPGEVISELWGLVAVAPLLETNLRAQVAPRITACDASLEGGGACTSAVPPAAARELWRFRGRPGAAPVLGARGLCFGGEVAEALPWTASAMWRWRRRATAGINLCEGRARRLLLRSLACREECHGTRQCVLYDSTVTAAGAAQGRSAARGLRAEQRRVYPGLLAADIQEGVLWCDSERNPADHPSRGSRRMPVPSPARPWVASWLGGDSTALPGRIGDLELLAHAQRAGAVQDEPDWSVGEHWRDERRNHRLVHARERLDAQTARRARLRAALHAPADVFDHTKGYEGEGPPRRSRTLPPAPRAHVDLGNVVLGTGATQVRRTRLVAAFDEWLHEGGYPARATLADDVPRLDELLCKYGQALWDDDAPQSHLPELLNALRKLHPAVAGRLKGAWDVRTAWQHLEPGDNKAAVPERLVRAVIAVALLWRWVEFAALVLLTFDGCLRPGDVLGLERRDLRFSEEHGGLGDDLFVVLRSAKTAAMRGARWQHVRIETPGVVRFIRAVFGGRPREARLFSRAGAYPMRARALAALFAAVLQFLRVPYGLSDGFVFSGLRAGGITSLFERSRDLPLTRWRGRWDSWRSMEHYIQELAASAAFADLPADVRRQVFRLSDALPRLIAAELGSVALVPP